MNITWEEIKPYLLIEKKLKPTRQDICYRFNLIKRVFKDNEFTRAGVVAWLMKEKDRGIKNATLNNHIKTIKWICDYLVHSDQMEKSFMDKFSYFEEIIPQMDVLNDEELERVINCVIPRERNSVYINFKWSLIIEILSIYVFRISELCNLEWGRGYDGDAFIIETGKTQSSIGKLEVLPYLKEKIAKLKKNKYNDYIFGSPKGKLDDDQLAKELKRRLEYLGIKKHITPHSLRRSGITNYIEKNVNQLKLIKVTRHKDFNSLNRYNHLAYKSATEILEFNPMAIKHSGFSTMKSRMLEFYESIKDAPYSKSIDQGNGYITLTIKDSIRTA